LNFKKHNHERLHEKIVEQIKSLIKNGTLSPGDQLLSERQLAEKLKVSRTCIREALTVLSSQGYIEIKPRGGAFVKSVDFENMVGLFADILIKEKENFFHILEIREVLEHFSARMAAQRATDVDLLNLYENACEIEEDITQERISTESDANFHINLAKATHNPVLTRITILLIEIMKEIYYEPTRRKFLQDKELSRIFSRQHFDIYEAVEARKSQLAGEKILEHIQTINKALMRADLNGNRK
jgi:GntR family transcriptional repressor for pyruvate dehydrogenase complex